MAKESTREGKAETTNVASKRNKQIRTGVAVGIGSAAIVAALLYANCGRKGENGGG